MSPMSLPCPCIPIPHFTAQQTQALRHVSLQFGIRYKYCNASWLAEKESGEQQRGRQHHHRRHGGPGRPLRLITSITMVTVVTAALEIRLERAPLCVTQRTSDCQLAIAPSGDGMRERVEMQVDVGVRLSPLATSVRSTQGLAA